MPVMKATKINDKWHLPVGSGKTLCGLQPNKWETISWQNQNLINISDACLECLKALGQSKER